MTSDYEQPAIGNSKEVLGGVPTEAIPLQDFTKTVDENVPKEEWLLLKERNRVARLLHAIWDGPAEAVDDPPSFPYKWALTRQIETLPDQMREKEPYKRRIILLLYGILVLMVNWVILEPYLVHKPFFQPADDHSAEGVPVISLGCNSYLNWKGPNNACGLHASMCEPFTEKEYIIRCPALCDQGGYVYSAIAVGDQRIKYRGYHIGGGITTHDVNDNESDIISLPYRADSFPCSAAVHAGIISPFNGGIARLSMDGLQTHFPSAKGIGGTGNSVSFDSFFPASYTFRSLPRGTTPKHCKDPRIPLTIFNIASISVLFYLASSAAAYWILTIAGYWIVCLSLDPPLLTDPHDVAELYELLSIGFQRLLPLCFVLYFFWKCAIKRTLYRGSNLCRIAFWYPTFWLGLMNNVTFDRLPVDRLTAKDLQEQAGALVAVSCIFATILLGVIIQAYSLWKSGRFRKYFQVYTAMIASILLLASIPGLNLRLHHYILGILLVPGCATKGISAYLFQGILVGLTVSGVSRWDFASIVETDIALLRGEAGSALEPPLFRFDSNQPHSISWSLNSTTTRADPSIDGFSLLLNDFEIYVGQNTSIDLDTLFKEDATLQSMLDEALQDSDGTVDLYFRVAQASTRAPTENRGDYTNAGLLEWPQGNWQDPLPGVS